MRAAQAPARQSQGSAWGVGGFRGIFWGSVGFRVWGLVGGVEIGLDVCFFFFRFSVWLNYRAWVVGLLLSGSELGIRTGFTLLGACVKSDQRGIGLLMAATPMM